MSGRRLTVVVWVSGWALNCAAIAVAGFGAVLAIFGGALVGSAAIALREGRRA